MHCCLMTFCRMAGFYLCGRNGRELLNFVAFVYPIEKGCLLANIPNS